jgi:hypothetical protein
MTADSERLRDLKGFQLRIHAMPCVNECSHCHSFGKPGSVVMEYDDIVRLLEMGSVLKDHIPLTGMFYLYEPTVHPRFVDIFEKQSELGLLWDNYFFPSNCYGLARLDDDGWRRLKEAGFDYIHLVFHGVGWDHDATVGRRRAYRDLLATIEKADEFDINWVAGVVVRSEIVNRIGSIIETVGQLGRKGHGVGAFVFNWLGRGAADELRPRERDMPKLPLDPEKWKSERQCVEAVLGDPDMAGTQASDILYDHVYLEVIDGRNVYCAGGCDSAPPKEFLPFLELGVLDHRGLLRFAENYRDNLPLPMRLLRGVTWGDLAERYGDRENDSIYHLRSIANQKWATLFLREHLPVSGTGDPFERSAKAHTW